MNSKILYIDLDEAFNKLVETCRVQPILERVSVNEAYRRVISQDVISPLNMPPEDQSHLDGFAIYAEDVVTASRQNPVILKLVGKIRLSEFPKAPLFRGETLGVPTGGALPRGANAIVPKEAVQEENGLVRIFEAVQKGKNVVYKGSDLKSGKLVLAKCSVLRAQDLSLLKLIGFQKVEVYKRPLVGLLSVGSELTDDFSEVSLGRVLSSHDLVIAKLVEEAGGMPRDLGIVPDDREMIRAKLSEGLSQASLILTIGGSSVGEADLVSETISSLGSPGMLVHGLKVQPGRVSGFGCINDKPIILLPGLIQSTINAFILFAFPLIRMFIGLSPLRWMAQVSARLVKTIRYSTFPEFKHITWVRLSQSGEGLEAEPIFGDSPMMNVLVKADGYVMSSEFVETIKEGDMVRVNLVPGLSSFTLI